jgi:hypothetical protein
MKTNRNYTVPYSRLEPSIFVLSGKCENSTGIGIGISGTGPKTVRGVSRPYLRYPVLYREFPVLSRFTFCGSCACIKAHEILAHWPLSFLIGSFKCTNIQHVCAAALPLLGWTTAFVLEALRHCSSVSCVQSALCSVHVPHGARDPNK